MLRYSVQNTFNREQFGHIVDVCKNSNNEYRPSSLFDLRYVFAATKVRMLISALGLGSFLGLY
jgi:hypothetical protein